MFINLTLIFISIKCYSETLENSRLRTIKHLHMYIKNVENFKNNARDIITIASN